MSIRSRLEAIERAAWRRGSLHSRRSHNGMIAWSRRFGEADPRHADLIKRIVDWATGRGQPASPPPSNHLGQATVLLAATVNAPHELAHLRRAAALLLAELVNAVNTHGRQSGDWWAVFGFGFMAPDDPHASAAAREQVESYADDLAELAAGL